MVHQDKRHTHTNYTILRKVKKQKQQKAREKQVSLHRCLHGICNHLAAGLQENQYLHLHSK